MFSTQFSLNFLIHFTSQPEFLFLSFLLLTPPLPPTPNPSPEGQDSHGEPTKPDTSRLHRTKPLPSAPRLSKAFHHRALGLKRGSCIRDRSWYYCQGPLKQTKPYLSPTCRGPSSDPCRLPGCWSRSLSCLCESWPWHLLPPYNPSSLSSTGILDLDPVTLNFQHSIIVEDYKPSYLTCSKANHIIRKFQKSYWCIPLWLQICSSRLWYIQPLNIQGDAGDYSLVLWLHSTL